MSIERFDCRPEVSRHIVHRGQDVSSVDLAPPGRIGEHYQVVLSVLEEPGPDRRVPRHRLFLPLSLRDRFRPALRRFVEGQLKQLMRGDPVAMIELADPVVGKLPRELELMVLDAARAIVHEDDQLRGRLYGRPALAFTRRCISLRRTASAEHRYRGDQGQGESQPHRIDG